MAATSPTNPATPKAAPTQAGPVGSLVRSRSTLRSMGVMLTVEAVTTAPRSTATSIDATPRTASLPAPPQATTVRIGRFDCTPATSKRRR